jgi:hypothetical protein
MIDFVGTAVTWVPKFVWDGQFSIRNGSLTLFDSLVVQNPITIHGCTVNGAGSILVSDTLHLTTTTIVNDIDIPGTITIQGGCRFNSSFTTHTSTLIRLAYISNYGSDLIVDNGFTNNGLIELRSNYYQVSAIIRTSNGPLVNSPTGTIDANSTDGGQMILAELDNQGTIDIGWPFRLDSSGANHTNSGTINITNGTVLIHQSGTLPSFTNTGTMTIDSGVILDVDGGDFSYSSGNISGQGTLDFYNTTISCVPKVAWDGPIVIFGGSLTISDSLLIQNPISIQGCSLDGVGSILVSDTLHLTNTTVANDIEIPGVITIQGACRFNGAFTTYTSTIIRLSYVSNYGSDLIVDNGFTNNGLLQMISNYYQTSAIIRTSNGPLVNSSTATITANSTDGGQMILAELDNQGTIEIGRLLRLDSASAHHTNSGTININGGDLLINQTGTSPSFTNAGTIVINSGYVLDVVGGALDNQAAGTLAGNGMIDLTNSVTSFTNAGIVNPGMSPGALTVNGMDMTQQSTCLINIEIESTTSGDFDSLAVIGDVTKGGILNVDLYNGYFPLVGDSIPFLSATAVSGDFDSLELQIGGIIFDTVSAADLVSLVCTQADNYDPTIALDSVIAFDVVDSAEIDLWAVADDPEYPDTLLSFSFSSDNDSLTTSYDPSTGIVTLAGDQSYYGVVELIVTVTDPKGAFAVDTIVVNVNNAQDVDDSGNALPGEFVLEQNYPNPFNPSTTISFTLPQRSPVRIDLYNIVGQKVTTISDKVLPAGSHQVYWDGTDQNGQEIATGIYFYRLEARDFVETKKMVLLK